MASYRMIKFLAMAVLLAEAAAPAVWAAPDGKSSTDTKVVPQNKANDQAKATGQAKANGQIKAVAENKGIIENKAELDKGKKIYLSNCEVCHLIGRNLVNPQKEIQNSKKMNDPARLKEFLSHSNGTMPAFAEIAKNDESVKHLREFLLYAKEHPSDVNKADSPVGTKAGVAGAKSSAGKKEVAK